MTGRFWIISYVISSLPLLVRLIQSVKRYADSGLSSHLINVSPITTDGCFLIYLSILGWQIRFWADQRRVLLCLEK